ncbi:ABC transporter ATP-binding protein [Abyssisolibacter fermentans]|uniref:ABC transporter ATP-binding protein n=1 Tax=Abyssisolibacter fermentans TaxID=1766203 RepID=UPI000831A508|nr:ABC transporter ATP-binding protein [Abyssisolibacter fermentans]
MIIVQDLVKTYGQENEKLVEVIKGMTFEIKDGAFVSIVGPSGSGKSTLLSMLGALNTPTSGKIIFDGIDISKLSENSLAELRQKTIGFVFQRFHLLPDDTALENVQLPMLYNNKISQKESIKRAKQLLNQVELSHRIDHIPMKMSGGECQRVAIARALVNNPKFILADEPTGNLDTESGYKIINLLKKINNEKGITVIVVTHNMEIASQTDKMIVIKDGLVERIQFNDK